MTMQTASQSIVYGTTIVLGNTLQKKDNGHT
jgi:hypothetical protein